MTLLVVANIQLTFTINFQALLVVSRSSDHTVCRKINRE